MKAIKCFYRGCKRPEVEEGPPVTANRPSDAKMWSDPATWENGLPLNDTDVTIKGRESFPCHNVLLKTSKESQNINNFDVHLTQ